MRLNDVPAVVMDYPHRSLQYVLPTSCLEHVPCNLIFFPPYIWHNLVYCSSSAHTSLVSKANCSVVSTSSSALMPAISTSIIIRQTRAEARYLAITPKASSVPMNNADENTKVPKIQCIYASITAIQLRQTAVLVSGVPTLKSSLTWFADGLTSFQSHLLMTWEGFLFRFLL